MFVNKLTLAVKCFNDELRKASIVNFADYARLSNLISLGTLTADAILGKGMFRQSRASRIMTLDFNSTFKQKRLCRSFMIKGGSYRFHSCI